MSEAEQAAIIYQVTEEQLKRIVSEAVAEFAAKHFCRFDVPTDTMNAFGRACKEHEITEGDLMVMVFSAKTAHGMAKTIVKKLFWTLFFVAVIIWTGSSEWFKTLTQHLFGK
jgi:hypothetical protein